MAGTDREHFDIFQKFVQIQLVGFSTASHNLVITKLYKDLLRKIHNIGLKFTYLDNSELAKLSKGTSAGKLKKTLYGQKSSIEPFPHKNYQYSSRNANKKLGGMFSETKLERDKVSPMRSTGFLKNKGNAFEFGK